MKYRPDEYLAFASLPLSEKLEGGSGLFSDGGYPLEQVLGTMNCWQCVDNRQTEMHEAM